MLLKMSILKMSSNTEIREKGECAAVRAVGQGLCGGRMAGFPPICEVVTVVFFVN
jgi:hypothetical protein